MTAVKLIAKVQRILLANTGRLQLNTHLKGVVLGKINYFAVIISEKREVTHTALTAHTVIIRVLLEGKLVRRTECPCL